ncbi:uncharacterized protein LOC116261560 [Nymphaea colorata]|nr:uncharacterized protein LOC116261560 [Nymphaea colorata]
MSLLKTHQTLQELFPQVDDRLLKAAAFEHGHEIEFAIEFVVEEVLPRMSLGIEHTSGLNGSCFATGDEFASSAENKETHFTVESHEDFPTVTHENATRLCNFNVNSEDASAIPVYRLESHEDFPSLATASRFPDSSSDIVEDSSTAPGLVSTECCACSDQAENSPNLVQDRISKTMGLSDFYELKNLFERKANASNIDNSELWKQESDDGHESLVFEEKMTMGTAEDSRSISYDGQTSQTTIDIVEDLINEASKNKDILLEAMDSVDLLMKEVGMREKEAESANLEAMYAGADILNNAEELKKLSAHGREANDMYAGEVHGEKSILATELREIRSHLRHISDKRDKYLSIIDELNLDLQARIAAANAAKAEAELQKLKKKELASKVLAQEKLIMEQVMEDSKKLHQQAEENSKLRQFLTDRGGIVDILQGQIEAICQDVELLKDRFHNDLGVCSPCFSVSNFTNDKDCSLSSNLPFKNQSTYTEGSEGSQIHEPVESVLGVEIASLDPPTVDQHEHGCEGTYQEGTPKMMVSQKEAWDEPWELVKEET